MDISAEGIVKGGIGGFLLGFVLQALTAAAQVAEIGAGVPTELILPITFLAGIAYGAVGLLD